MVAIRNKIFNGHKSRFWTLWVLYRFEAEHEYSVECWMHFDKCSFIDLVLNEKDLKWSKLARYVHANTKPL